MDLIRLPPSLRRSILSQTLKILQPRRSISTAAPPISHHDAPIPLPSQELLTPTLNSYTVSNPPKPSQLKYAASYFTTAPPKILYSAAHFRSFPPSPHPEVAFLGRSNVGKSSLLNALFGRTKDKPVHVSKRPGRTKTMNGFGVAGPHEWGTPPKDGAKDEAWRRFPRGGLVVVDMPGYGAGSREVWGEEALKFLQRRRQLRRTFVLVDAEHGLKGSDVWLLTHLRRQGVSYQVVLSKVDKVLLDGSKVPGSVKMGNRLLKLQETCGNMRKRLDEEADDGRQMMSDILYCSAEHSLEESKHRKIGIDEVRWAVLSACGLESDASGQKRKTGLEGINVIDGD